MCFCLLLWNWLLVPLAYRIHDPRGRANKEWPQREPKDNGNANEAKTQSGEGAYSDETRH